MLTDLTKSHRGKALEEMFFFKMDMELIHRLNKQQQKESILKAIAEAIGAGAGPLTSRLTELGIKESWLAAFLWVPAVFVGWADGSLDEIEKRQLCEGLKQKGISENSLAILRNSHWFNQKPGEELWNTWHEFASYVLTESESQDRKHLVVSVLRLCNLVAQASGGVLGVGRVSKEEMEIIDRVTAILHRYPESALSPERTTQQLV